jgi:hypothetical protein
MNKALTRIRSAVLALVASSMMLGQAFAGQNAGSPAFESPVQKVQVDCYAIGQQVAAQNGGQLARASVANRGGRQVCVIVVLVPGKDGQRPRRAEFVVPAN